MSLHPAGFILVANNHPWSHFGRVSADKPFTTIRPLQLANQRSRAAVAGGKVGGSRCNCEGLHTIPNYARKVGRNKDAKRGSKWPKTGLRRV